MKADGFAVEIDADGGLTSGVAGGPDGDIGARELVGLILLVCRPIGGHQHLYDGNEVAELIFGGGGGIFGPVANVLRGARGSRRHGGGCAALVGYGL